MGPGLELIGPARAQTPGPRADVITLRDGLLVRFKVHLDRAKALEAAGLSE